MNGTDGTSTLPGESPDGSRGDDQQEAGGNSATREGVDIAPSKALIGATLAFVVVSLATSAPNETDTEAEETGNDEIDGVDDPAGGLLQ